MPVLFRVMDIIFALSTPFTNWAYSKAPLKVSGIMDFAFAAAKRNNTVKCVIVRADSLTDKCTIALDSWMETQGAKYPIIAQTREHMIHFLHFCEAMVEPLRPRLQPPGFGAGAPTRRLAIDDSFDFDWSTESDEFDLHSSPQTTHASSNSPSIADVDSCDVNAESVTPDTKDDDTPTPPNMMRQNADALFEVQSDEDSALPEASEGDIRHFDVRSAMAPVAIAAAQRHLRQRPAVSRVASGPLRTGQDSSMQV
eukprot:GEMP01046217.1.p1 GENE.GEMP01046217.1~~GEMP01046217.1.p1  ORF type:complete len:254 (+),score=46.86 GEMP01046217.1:129-890(+)